ncbi:MAG: hypothetical protein LBF27_34035 [Sphingobacterium sp.]|jgi:hypothetical protein|nr:hypothetical protein [Sphingobacterium sp.]
MIKTLKIKIVGFVLSPLKVASLLASVLLCFFFLFHGSKMLLGDGSELLMYLNIYSKEPISNITIFQEIAMRCVGILLGITSVTFFLSFLLIEPINQKRELKLMKWAVFISMSAMSIYGGLIRGISNQQGAANIFYFTMLLYILYLSLEKLSQYRTPAILSNLKLLPIYLTFAYTMGLPGWAKIVTYDKVINKYQGMFAGSFVDALPGGVPLMIMLLGLLESLVPLLLVISIFKGEFSSSKEKPWLKFALITTCLTFMMLCFGLTILFNFPGSSNLVYYFIFTLLVIASLANSSSEA